METIKIKVEPAQIGFNSFGWMAYSEQLGGIDYSCEDGESWSNCGSPQGEGQTIQDALADFLDKAWEVLAKANPDDKRFDDLSFEPKFSWS